MSAGAIIGREDELGEIQACLTAAAEGPAGLLLTGEPGIGKTALWEAGIGLARERDFRVLTHRSVAAEAGFAFAGLSDLVAPVFGEVADELAPPRRAALEVALLLADAGGRGPPDPHAIGLALHDVVRLLAEASPVVVGLDDLQWLDASSAAVLPAALRRLDGARACIVATTRVVPAGTSPWPGVPWHTLDVGPLEPAAMHTLLRRDLGLDLPRPQLARLHAAAGGNPFFAIELARTGALHRADGPMRVPDSLRALLGERLNDLPDDVADVLLTVAALARPSLDLVASCHEDPVAAAAALDDAEAAGVLVVVDDSRIRFTHPLLASLCYERCGPSRRRATHRRLADVVRDPEERARHLASAMPQPDAAVAEELEAAAAHAAARGGAVTAAELAELAAARTPEGAHRDRTRRRVQAARMHWLAGDLERAHTIYDGLVAELPAGVERAALLHVMSLTGRADMRTRVALCEQAVSEVGNDDARAVEILAQLATFRWFLGNIDAAMEAARAGVAKARRLGDLRLLVIARAALAYVETWTRNPTPGVVEEALADERRLGEPLPFYQSATFSAALRSLYRDDPQRARALLMERMASADAGGDHTHGFALPALVTAEWLLGQWGTALAHASAAVEFAAQTHDPQYTVVVCWSNAVLYADVGRVDEARATAAQGVEAASGVGDEMFGPAALAALGHAELVAGDPERAARHFRDLPERMLRAGGQGVLSTGWADAIETLIRIGELDPAAEHLERWSAVIWNRFARIGMMRCTGLLADARGDSEAAVETLERAVTADNPPTYPFERARTLLALGAVRRHALQRRAARSALEEALAAFEHLGAAPWADRARDELRRVSGRRPSGELTEAELRVATLAAAGNRNKEIATTLFIEVGTVEAHLSRAYLKLGVHSRTELSVRLSDAGGRTPKV